MSSQPLTAAMSPNSTAPGQDRSRMTEAGELFLVRSLISAAYLQSMLPAKHSTQNMKTPFLNSSSDTRPPRALTTPKDTDPLEIRNKLRLSPLLEPVCSSYWGTGLMERPWSLARFEALDLSSLTTQKQLLCLSISNLLANPTFKPRYCHLLFEYQSSPQLIGRLVRG